MREMRKRRIVLVLLAILVVGFGYWAWRQWNQTTRLQPGDTGIKTQALRVDVKVADFDSTTPAVLQGTLNKGSQNVGSARSLVGFDGQAVLMFNGVLEGADQVVIELRSTTDQAAPPLRRLEKAVTKDNLQSRSLTLLMPQ